MTIPEEIEKLKSLLEETADEREQAEILIQILKKSPARNGLDSHPFVERLLLLAEHLKEPLYEAFGLFYLSYLKRELAQYDESLNICQRGLAIFEELNHGSGMASSYINMGYIYWRKGDLPKALQSYLAALKISEEAGDKSGIAESYNGMGPLFEEQENYPEALKNYFAAVKIREEIGDRSGIADTYTNIGIIYFRQDNYPETLNYFNAALKIREELGSKSGIADSYNNLGSFYNSQGKLSEALDCFFYTLKFYEEIGDKFRIASLYYNISVIYEAQGKINESLKYLFDALKIAEEIGNKNLSRQSYLSLSITYADLGKHDTALTYYQKYHELEKEILGAESQKQLNNLNFMHNLEQKEKELEIEYLRNVELKQERDRINSLFKQIEEEKKKVEEKNTEIIQSITYALKIQNAILPPMSTIRQILPDSFVLFMPKDIVSGDFYWMEVSPQGRIFFAACDCTGHGVPGAMVSMVCHNALNRAVHEYNLTQPSLILDKVCELVVGTFKTGDDDVRDGMDISLCALDPATMSLQWAGANNPLWLLRGSEIIETKADKQPIGATDYGHQFTNHTFDLKAGDIIYLFSDGYADQFGGADGKKLTRKRLRQLILDLQTTPVTSQGAWLEKYILEYRGDTFQIDDILVMGVKI